MARTFKCVAIFRANTVEFRFDHNKYKHSQNQSFKILTLKEQSEKIKSNLLKLPSTRYIIIEKISEAKQAILTVCIQENP